MPASIFAGSKVKTLKDTLTLNGFSDIISSTVDPTASAVDAPIGSLLINRTSGKLYRKLDAGSSVNWEEVGSGTGGINYILNPSAEVNTTGWATYADAAGTAPVDGTGGSPTVTWTRSTTSPLRGVADFNFAKDAANRQGQGVSYDFTIDEADKAKVLTVAFDYEVLSGTYADGDLTVYLIADPAGTPLVIQPAGYTVQSATVGTTMRQSATFQTQATGTSYRLCFHVASTSASAYTLAIDNVVVGPQQTVQGAAISDWVDYTPTGSWTANASYSGKWRRVGDSMEISIYVLCSGLPSPATTLEVSMPTNFSIDSAKLVGGTGVSLRNNFGSFTVFDSGGSPTGYIGEVTGASSYPTYAFRFLVQNASTGTTQISPSSPISWNNGDSIVASIKIPISGWSSNTVMSDSTDTRVVAFKAYATANTSIPTGAETAITYDAAALIDTHGAWNGTSSYIAPVSGYYDVSVGRLGFAANATGSRYFVVSVGGSTPNANLVDFNAAPSGTVITYLNGKTIVYANAGQAIQIKAFQSSGGNLNVGASSSVSITRVSGPATVAASEIVACGYEGCVTTLSIGGATLVFPSKLFDTHNTMNTSTGFYTVPVTGKYRLDAFLLTDNTTGIASITLTASQSGSLAESHELNRATTKNGLNAASGRKVLAGSCVFNCAAGDLLNVTGFDADGINCNSATRVFITKV